MAVVLAGIYVGYQALQVLFPPNTYETAMLATVADTVSADGVLLFDETYISGSGTLGYLAADGERLSMQVLIQREDVFQAMYEI